MLYVALHDVSDNRSYIFLNLTMCFCCWNCLVRFNWTQILLPPQCGLFGQVWTQVRTKTTGSRPSWRGGLSPVTNELWLGSFVVRTCSDLDLNQLQSHDTLFGLNMSMLQSWRIINVHLLLYCLNMHIQHIQCIKTLFSSWSRASFSNCMVWLKWTMTAI